MSRAVLEAAGLARGMRVLDIGCGAGDLSFLAAEVVGRSGSVLGIDRAPEAIAAAKARARERGLKRVRFRIPPAPCGRRRAAFARGDSSSSSSRT